MSCNISFYGFQRVGSPFLGLFFGYRFRVNGKIKVKGQIDKKWYSLKAICSISDAEMFCTPMYLMECVLFRYERNFCLVAACAALKISQNSR